MGGVIDVMVLDEDGEVVALAKYIALVVPVKVKGAKT